MITEKKSTDGRFTTTDGCHLAYHIHHWQTARPVLVFLNGTGQTAFNWTRLARRLKNDFRILRYDGRAQAHNLSGTRSAAIEVYAEDYIALADHLDIPQAHLVGVSAGAKLAIAISRLYPQRVNALIGAPAPLAAVGHGQVLITAWENILARGGMTALAWAMVPMVFGERFLSRQERLLPSIVKSIVSQNCAEAMAVRLAGMRENTDKLLTSEPLRHPTLLISGKDDLIAPAHAIAPLARQIGANHQTLKSVGHSIAIEAPDWFETLLRDFLCDGPISPKPEASKVYP